MKMIKTFETWNNNVIDNNLFSSGKAKYDPKVIGGVIKYSTGTIEPYYFAEIERKGGKFVCKIYKKKKDGDEIRLRNKLKNDLKTAHNYVREFLNQKLKRKKKSKKSKDRRDMERVYREPKIQREENPFNLFNNTPMTEPSRSKTIIRRFS